MFDLTTPCSNCPFRKRGGIRLTVGRVREIASAFTDRQGSTFCCHKTTDDQDDDDDDDARRGGLRTGEQMCAGGLIFAEKQGRANQAMRIAERIGIYDAGRLRGHALVFDSLQEMLSTALRGQRRKVKR